MRLRANELKSVTRGHSEEGSFVQVEVTNIDIRHDDSLIHPVIGLVTLNMLTNASHGTQAKAYSRLTEEVIRITVSASSGSWEVLDGSVEVTRDFQTPEALLPDSTGQKHSALGDVRVRLVVGQINLDHLKLLYQKDGAPKAIP